MIKLELSEDEVDFLIECVDLWLDTSKEVELQGRIDDMIKWRKEVLARKELWGKLRSALHNSDA